MCVSTGFFVCVLTSLSSLSSFCTRWTSLHLWQLEADGLYSQPEGTGVQLQNFAVLPALCHPSQSLRDPWRLKALGEHQGILMSGQWTGSAHLPRERRDIVKVWGWLFDTYSGNSAVLTAVPVNSCAMWWMPVFYSLGRWWSFSTCLYLFIPTDILQPAEVSHLFSSR